MKIPVTLNGSQTILEADPEEKLLTVLRRLRLISVKKGCGKGLCGCCSVLLDSRPVPSCLLPVGAARGSTIITLEHFSKTVDYTDIMNGFKQAGAQLCGYCNAGKVFAVYDLISRVYRPSKEDLMELADGLTCTCTDRNTFINGVLYAVANKHRREGAINV